LINGYLLLLLNFFYLFADTGFDVRRGDVVVRLQVRETAYRYVRYAGLRESCNDFFEVPRGLLTQVGVGTFFQFAAKIRRILRLCKKMHGKGDFAGLNINYHELTINKP